MMRRLFVLLAAAVLCASVPAHAATSLKTALRNDLTSYLQARAKAEHISAASLSVSLADGSIVDVAAGTTSIGGSQPVTPASLFQIGSNTKAFTAVAALKLQSAGKLGLNRPIGTWLPQYPAWKNATISQMLHMISGISTYDDTAAWGKAISSDPYRNFTAAELIAFVNQKAPLAAHKWIYSNTGYLLTQLVIQKTSGTSYADFLRNNVIAPTNIDDIYYSSTTYPSGLRARTVSGYFDNDDPDDASLAPLLGKDVRDYSISWTQGAGGILATPHAVALWARDMYQGSIVLAAERRELETLVSTKTADPIPEVSASDPASFGLGLSQLYKPGLGRFWFYEGMTLGYRVIHCYFPKQNVVIAFGLNSQPRSKENKSGELVQSIVKTLQAYGKF